MCFALMLLSQNTKTVATLLLMAMWTFFGFSLFSANTEHLSTVPVPIGIKK